MDKISSIDLFLRKNFSEYNIIYSAPPSYIQTLTGSSEKIFFINILSKTPKRQRQESDSFNFASAEQSRDLDLTGSPLKDNCDIEAIDIGAFDSQEFEKTPWDDCEVQYEHINIDLARQIITDINTNSKNFNNQKASVWILCDSSDNQQIVLLETCIDQKFTRGIVSVQDNIPSKSIKMENLLSQHHSYISNLCNVDCTIETFFNIKSNTTLKLTAKTNLKKDNCNLYLNNYANADILLCQNIKIGNINSVAYNLWNELTTINTLKDVIVKYKKQNNDKIDPIYQNECGLDIFSLKETIHKYLTEVNLYSQEEYSELNSGIEGVVNKAKFRDCYDVTDKLWNILKYSNYSDLKASFHYMFQCAAKFNIVNMPTNKTRLAELVRLISEKHFSIPSLNGIEPLELLLEIGLEKITKDYEFIFVESKICNAKDLQLNENVIIDAQTYTLNVRKSLFVAAAAGQQSNHATAQRKTLVHGAKNMENNDQEIIENRTFNKKKVEMQLDKLVQVHLLLEHLILLQINLYIENVKLSIINEVLQREPISFNKIISKNFDYLEIPMTFDKILVILQKNIPYAKRIVLTSENNFKKVKNTFYFCVETIFPNNNTLSASTQHIEQENTEINYCQLHYLQLTTKY